MARIIAPTAFAALGLSGAPVHEPVHARGPTPVILLLCVTSLERPACVGAAGSVAGLCFVAWTFPDICRGWVVIALECWLSSASSWEVTAAGIMPSGGADPRC
jgi:hypothetical protein